MAEDQVGLRTEAPRTPPLWMKLFSGFKVALDPKKLLLAAAGIVTMWLGWWVLSLVFFTPRSTPPRWDSYKGTYENDDKNEKAWKAFKEARNRWNLLYEMAGPVPATVEEASKVAQYDAADLASSPTEYDQIEAEVSRIKQETSLRTAKVHIDYNANDKLAFLRVGDYKIRFEPPTDKDNLESVVKSLRDQNLTPTKLLTSRMEPKTNLLPVGDTTVKLPVPKQWDDFFNALVTSKQFSDIEQEIRTGRRQNAEVAKKALQLVVYEGVKFKPAGYLRTSPWEEYRGPNPYLLVTGRAGTMNPATPQMPTWGQGYVLGWFFHDEVPVLLEPLVKFFRPVLYMLHPAAGGWNRIYLFLIILWGLATWALFGGAITRMAAVQVARNNEKIGMTEALRFAWSRIQSFFSAPLLPLAFIGILALFLFIYGLLVHYTWFVGDVLFAGLLLPLALILGLIIAVVLVGLVGWPLMYATISTEGSDSFDAISRSYSYVYQAPWHYLWYALVAVAYGAVLVFFVGLMGSLIAYTTKWGANLAPSTQGREPSYLFTYAPESFGWRDLLLYQGPNAVPVDVVRQNGLAAKALQVNFSDAYPFSLSNRIGAGLVAFWLGVLFLLVVGFGYSYFWTASTIIYLLMRRKVDDTDLDEIHLEEEAEEPYVPPTPAATAPPAGKPGATPLTMVEPPTLKAPSLGSGGPAPPTPAAATAAVGPPFSPPPTAPPVAPPAPPAAPPVEQAASVTPPSPEVPPPPELNAPAPGTIPPPPENGPERGPL